MGAVLLSAVFAAFREVYTRKTDPILRLAMWRPSEAMSSELVSALAAEAKKLAEEFLNLCIRALDYCPPIDLHLGDYLRALITADRELVPDDPWAYRDALIGAFAEHGIYPEGVGQLTEDELRWRPPSRYIDAIGGLSFANLRFAGEPSLPASESELIRQAEVLWQAVTRPHVTEEFGLSRTDIDGAEPPVIQSIRTARRIGPDGQVLFDLVAELTQHRPIRDPHTGAEANYFGGCTLIIGPEGEVRYVVSKGIQNAARLKRQVEYQRRSTLWSTVENRYVLTGDPHRTMHERFVAPEPSMPSGR